MKLGRYGAWLVAFVSAMPAVVILGSGSFQVAGQGQAGGGRVPAQTGRAGAPPAGQPPQKGSGLVLGQVVDAASGSPVSEATVAVTSRVPIASLTPPSGTGGPMRFITGADGRFVLHDLPKTNLQISVTASGYINGSSGQSRPGGPSRPVEVDDGLRLGDVKIRLWRYGVLTGMVVDEAGEPAVGVAVRAMRKSLTAGKPGYSQSGSATTDDRGVYRISALTPGEYVVAVPQTISTMPAAILDSLVQSMVSGMPQVSGLADLAMSGGPSPMGMGTVRIGPYMVSSASGVMPAPAADGRIFIYQSLFYPAATSSAQAAVVTLRSGEERSGLDLQLKVTQALRVSGTVTGPAGPVGSVSVRLMSTEVDELGGGAGFETATAATAADGTFTFLGVPSGQYVARVAKQPRPPMPAGMGDNPAMAFAFGMAAGGGAGGTAALYAQASIGVNNTDVTGVSLALAEGAKVSGRIEFVGDAPQPTPQQLQTIGVALTPVGGSSGPSSAPGRAGQDGSFKTPGYPAGKYDVEPNGRGGGPGWTVRSAMSGGRDVLNEPLELRDSDVNDVVITFTDKVSQITGSVHVPAAATTSAATVILFPADYRSWIAKGMNRRLTRTALVPKAGTFTLANLSPGEYLLAALDDADVPENQDAAFYDALARVASRVMLREGEKPTQNLEIVKVKK